MHKLHTVQLTYFPKGFTTYVSRRGVTGRDSRIELGTWLNE